LLLLLLVLGLPTGATKCGTLFPCRLFHVPLLDVERHLPMKALFPFSGFWREHQGAYVPPDASPALIRFTHSCWSTDVLLHGSHNFLGARLSGSRDPLRPCLRSCL
jgi:hypothetical protein